MDPQAALAVLIAIVTVYALANFLGRFEVVRGRVACPETGSVAEVEVVQRYAKPDEPVRVRSCSLLPVPKRVDCGQDCLRCRRMDFPRRGC